MHEPNPAPIPSVNEPDYSKVRGWLLFMGIFAGYEFVSGVWGTISGLNTGYKYLEVMASPARDVHMLAVGLNFVTPFIALAQCVLIFQRKRLARNVSLGLYGLNIASTVILLPFLGALIDAVSIHVPAEMSGILKSSVVIGTLINLALMIACFCYFLVSDRVHKTLVR